MAGLLDDIRVLDWTQWQMGTVASAMLADLGAEVIHIENRLTGDGGRGLNQLFWAVPEGRNSYFECNNRGKKGIAIELTKDNGKEVIYRLVKKSDAFVHNYRQGVPERLKLDYETLRQHNPRLIYAAVSGYGPKGPEAREPVSSNPLVSIDFDSGGRTHPATDLAGITSLRPGELSHIETLSVKLVSDDNAVTRAKLHAIATSVT